MRSKLPYKWPGLRNSSPNPSRCRSCKSVILVGYYEGWAIYLDALDLDPRGEAEAWILGLPTYHAVPPHLYKRSVMTINDDWRPKQGFIFRTHRCGQVPSTYLRVRPVVSDQCDF